MNIALVDLGSFVLPYDFHLITGLGKNDHRVSIFCSRTAYNAEFIEALMESPKVDCSLYDISSSKSSLIKSFLSYGRALRDIYRRRNEFDSIIFQFPKIWPIEIPFLFLIRKKLDFLIHNPVPHGHAGNIHGPTLWAAHLAKRLLFASDFSMRDFLRRYGDNFKQKSLCIPHGALAPSPHDEPIKYGTNSSFEAIIYWSNVKPYKGIELILSFAETRTSEDLPIEIHGKWDNSLKGLKSKFRDADVLIEDAYLTQEALATLLRRNALFVLPYISATQSGALYTLLHSGRVFAASDSGDMGDFLRTYGLDGLLIKDHTAPGLRRCIDYAQRNLTYIQSKLSEAQQDRDWEKTISRNYW